MPKYATGKYAKAISDRSGLEFPYREMVREWNGFLVHYSEYEPKRPQLDPRFHGGDPQALRNARPQPASVDSLILLPNDTQSRKHIQQYLSLYHWSRSSFIPRGLVYKPTYSCDSKICCLCHVSYCKSISDHFYRNNLWFHICFSCYTYYKLNEVCHQADEYAPTLMDYCYNYLKRLTDTDTVSSVYKNNNKRIYDSMDTVGIEWSRDVRKKM